MEIEEFENTVEYKGETYPVKEITLPLQAIWEYLGYLEISLDCFDTAIQNPQSDFFMIKTQIGNYAKERLEVFINNNDYFKSQNGTPFSFNFFNGNFYFNADIEYKLSCRGQMFKYQREERDRNVEYLEKIIGVEKKNIILDGSFVVDTYPYLELTKKEYKDSPLEFWTDKEIFKELYECAQKEMKTRDKDFSYFRPLLIQKLNALNKRRDSYSEQLISTLTNQYLIHWYIILQKYIDMAVTLLESTDKDKVDTKLIVYILKTLCKYGLNINVTSDDFFEFTKRLMGTTLSTTKKYLYSSDLSDKEGFLDTWVEGVELLSILDKENPLVRECIKEALKQKPERTIKSLSVEQKEIIDKIRQEYPSKKQTPKNTDS